jgi:hypothetical protein
MPFAGGILIGKRCAALVQPKCGSAGSSHILDSVCHPVRVLARPSSRRENFKNFRTWMGDYPDSIPVAAQLQYASCTPPRKSQRDFAPCFEIRMGAMIDHWHRQVLKSAGILLPIRKANAFVATDQSFPAPPSTIEQSRRRTRRALDAQGHLR